MADFFDDGGQSQTETEVQKIFVGDKEYTQDELSRYVGLGKLAEEAETKYNTKIDKVWPEYTRSQQELKELRKLKEERETHKAPEIPEDEQLRQAREAARKVGIVTEDAFGDMLGKSFRQFYVQERAAEKLLEEADSLESKYNGSDGRPKFSSQEILEHMRETGIRNPEKAYKDKYEAELDAWKESQLREAKKPGLVTRSTTVAGGKQPPAVKITSDNLDDLVKQGLRGEL